jgi:hypothetical protein
MPEMSPEDALEVEADRRRRVTGAFRLGKESSPRTREPSSGAQLAAGMAIAIAVILVLGVIAITHH